MNTETDESEEDYKNVETTKKAHALEKWLNLEEESTEVEKVTYNFPRKESKHYDSKDREIEEQAHKIFEEAMSGYLSLESLLSSIEPKYRARMAEVALAYLNTALDATDTKNKQKESLEKLKLQKEKLLRGSDKSDSTVFVTADRNKLLKELRKEYDKRNGVIDINSDDSDDSDEGNTEND